MRENVILTCHLKPSQKYVVKKFVSHQNNLAVQQ